MGLLVFTVALGLTCSIAALRENSPFLLFYGAVVTSALLWGTGPGLVNAGLSLVSIAAIVARGWPHRLDLTDYVRLAVFSVICLLVIELGRQRHRAELRLVDREQYFRRLIENTSDIITIVDQAGTVRYESPSVTRLGYTLGELVGHSIFGLFHPDDLPGALEFHRHLEAGERMPAIELRVRHKDGRYSFFEASANLLDDAARGSVVVVWRDVTSRVQAAESFRALLESAPDAIVGTDDHGRIALVNTQSEQMFGYTRQELMGSPIELLIPSRFQDSHVEHRQRYGADPGLRPMRTRDTDLFGRRKDGTEFPAEVSLSPIRTERGTVIVGIVRDISERRKAEAQRAELIRVQAAHMEAEAARKRYRNLVQNLEAIVWELDVKSGRMTFVSRRAAELLGISTDSWLNETDAWMEHVHPEDRPKLREFIATVPEQASASLEYRATTATGRQLWLRLIADRIHDQREPAEQLRGLTVDVTELKQAEDSLRNNEKLAATGRLAASIAHEINNPIAAVTNLLYLIETQAGFSEQVRQYARMGQEETGRMAHITRQMLGFYRDSTAPVPVNIPEVLQGTLQLYGRRLREERIVVEQKFESVPAIRAFPGEMRQVFSNLLVNAIEAVGKGGHIIIKAVPARDWSEPRRSGIRVTFADNGSGIHREHRQRIFDPFFTTKGENGTGLGLWVSYGILVKHSGNIRVHSSIRPGQSGTTFSIFLPAEPVSTQVPSVRASEESEKTSAQSAR